MLVIYKHDIYPIYFDPICVILIFIYMVVMLVKNDKYMYVSSPLVLMY